MNEIKSVVVADDQFEVWSDDEQRFIINSPSNFYIINGLGEKVFYCTKDRALAQQQSDLEYGKGKYTIRAVRDQKTKSKSESGGLSCYGSNTRRGFSPRLKGLK